MGTLKTQNTGKALAVHARTSRAVPTLTVAALLMGGASECSTIVDLDGSVLVADAADPTRTVCDPFANNPAHPGFDLAHGVVGRLRYLPAGAPIAQSVHDFETGAAVEPDVNLFMDNIFVPTRAFDRGFTTQSGELVLNASGNTLYENFYVSLESTVSLRDSDAEGDYQFALLADDGAILSVDRGSGFQEWVNNDGLHSTQFKIAAQAIHLSHGQSLPIKVVYNQGPRYHIALSLLWRKVGYLGLSDPSNNTSGNSRFFDSAVVPSAWKPEYYNLISRGWSPVPSANLVLPASVASNPCRVANEQVLTRIDLVDPAAPVTNSSSIRFHFSSSAAGATFDCTMDGVNTPCTSPVSYFGLTSGTHDFSVYASKGGVRDDVGSSYQWLVDQDPPGATNLVRILGSTSVTIQWSTLEPTTTSLRWGPQGMGMPFVVPDDGVLSITHTVTLNGLAPNSRYDMVLAGHDAAGNELPAFLNGFGTLR